MQLFCRTLQPRSCPDPIGLDHFLLPDNHPWVKAELASRQAPSRSRKGTNQADQAEWMSVEVRLGTHSCRSVLEGSSWGSAAWPDDSGNPDARAWFETLTRREQQSLMSHMSSLRGDLRDHCLIDVSQSVERRTMSKDARFANCVTPQSRWWHSGRHRLVLGAEKMLLQGLMVNPEQLQKFSNSFHNDIAGNAFSGPDVAKVVLAMLAAVSESPLAQKVVCAEVAEQLPALSSSLLKRVSCERSRLGLQ